MYHLTYSQQTEKAASQIRERMARMSLTFREEKYMEGNRLVLSDNDLCWAGREEINLHLDDLEEELKQWYYCQC